VDSPRPDQTTPVPSEEQAGRPASEARREALKRFGRYAAVAPTVMILLAGRQGHAAPPAWVPGPPPSTPPPEAGGYD
jgi:hypothetical protein